MTTKELAVKQNSEPQEISVVNPEALIMAAINKGVSIDVMERLLAMRERIQKDIAEKAFREAMSSFQAKCPIVVKSAGVDYISKTSQKRITYQYAPLDAIVAAVREPLGENGLSYTFTTEQSEKSVTAICHVHHVLGHTESTAFTVPVDPEAYMNAAQKVAAALTYAKRYAFCNGFGILTGDEDTDANDKSGDEPKEPPKTAPAQSTPPPATSGNPTVEEFKRTVLAAHKQGRTKDITGAVKAAAASLSTSEYKEFIDFVNATVKRGA